MKTSTLKKSTYLEQNYIKIQKTTLKTLKAKIKKDSIYTIQNSIDIELSILKTFFTHFLKFLKKSKSIMKLDYSKTTLNKESTQVIYIFEELERPLKFIEETYDFWHLKEIFLQEMHNLQNQTGLIIQVAVNMNDCQCILLINIYG